MGKFILLGCYEVPGWGGASTATYRLFEIMRSHGLNVGYLNIIAEQDSAYFKYLFGKDYGNPRSLDNVHTCHLNAPLDHPHPELTAILRSLSPDLMVGVGDLASHLMKLALPETKLVFMTTGCQQIQEAIRQGKVRDFIELERMIDRARVRDRPSTMPRILSTGEETSVALADLIIAHSEMTLFLFRNFFPSHVDKLYSDVIWKAEWIYQEALTYSHLGRPFAERDIDALFVSNSWERKEKNYELVKELVPLLGGLEIHIVGEARERIPHATHHGLIRNREEMFRLMGRAKAVVSPSLFDAAPGILFEASAMGCNIVASKNCGNWRICHDALLVDPFAADGFAEKIALGKLSTMPDNMGRFLRAKSYDNLVETLAVI